MSWKRSALPWLVIVAFAGVLSLPSAQEPPAAPDDNTSQPENDQGEKKETPPPEAPKARFWGDRFALYVAASYGSGSDAKAVDASIVTSSTASAGNALSLDDVTFGRLTIGWQLPAQRGHLLVAFDGYREEAYTLDSVGYLNRASTSAVVSYEPIRWWTLVAKDGHLVSERNAPIWTPPDSDGPNDDRNEDGRPSQDEVSYGEPDVVVSRGVAESLQTRLQTYEVLYQREFGGRTVNGRWSAGLRHFVYEGYVPAGAWLSNVYADGFGFTDGDMLRLLAFSQDTSGDGPTGSLGVQWHLFQDRVVLFGFGKVALIVQSLDTDSGPFFVPVRNPSGDQPSLYPAPARLQDSISKTSWQVGAEAGFRVRLLPGLHFEAAYNRTSFQDCILLPINISTPTTMVQADFGVAALYKTRDLMLDSWHAGFGFQF